jgi:hypothetical protein
MKRFSIEDKQKKIEVALRQSELDYFSSRSKVTTLNNVAFFELKVSENNNETINTSFAEREWDLSVSLGKWKN